MIAIAASMLALFLCAATFRTTAGATPEPTRYQGRTILQWHRLAVIRRVERDRARGKAGDAIRAHRRDRRLYLHRSDVLEAIRLAATTWHVSYGLLLRRAMCETGGSLNPYSKNRSSSASGVFQFLTSTWASTPYRSESIWSPYANSLAAAWMQSVGRGGEWVCRG